jgi:hypothetical protein
VAELFARSQRISIVRIDPLDIFEGGQTMGIIVVER